MQLQLLDKSSLHMEQNCMHDRITSLDTMPSVLTGGVPSVELPVFQLSLVYTISFSNYGFSVCQDSVLCWVANKKIQTGNINQLQFTEKV